MPPAPQQTPSGHRVTGKMWGITKPQLNSFLHRCQADASWDEQDSVRDLVRKFVVPWTTGYGMGYSLLMNSDDPKEVHVMLSHSWNENAASFLRDVQAYVREEEVMFICFLALYQAEDGAGPTINEQLGDDVHFGPFADVISNIQAKRAEAVGGPAAAGRMIVITCQEVVLYETALWCVWEAFVAFASGVEIVFSHRGLLYSSPEGSSLNATTSRPEDQEAIHCAILKHTFWSDHIWNGVEATACMFNADQGVQIVEYLVRANALGLPLALKLVDVRKMISGRDTLRLLSHFSQLDMFLKAKAGIC